MPCVHSKSGTPITMMKYAALRCSTIPYTGPMTDALSRSIRRFYSVLMESGYELFVGQRNMHDLVANAVSQDWVSIANHRKAIRSVLERIVVEGRECREFERSTALDEVVLALGQAAVPFAHPMLLAQRDLKDLRKSAAAVARLVVRGLAP
jgi:hypothetical protein